MAQAAAARQDANGQSVSLLLPESPDACRQVGQTYKQWGEWLIERAARLDAGLGADDGVARHPFRGPGLQGNLDLLLHRVTPMARWLLLQIARDNLSQGRAEARAIRERADQAHPGSLGGWIRSIAAASKQLGWPKPYVEEYGPVPEPGRRRMTYRMRPAVARAIVSLLDEDGGFLTP